MSARNYKGKSSSGERTSESEGITKLSYGHGNNFLQFTREFSRAAERKYYKLALIFTTGKYHVYPPVDVEQFEFNGNALQKRQAELNYSDAIKVRSQNVNRMEEDKLPLFTFILDNLSPESEDAVKQQDGWQVAFEARDPLALWKLVEATHIYGTTSIQKEMVKTTARKNYQGVKQGPFESIVEYKERFDTLLKAYSGSGNVVPAGPELAMDFFTGLDNRYEDFKTQFTNNVTAKIQTAPATLRDMYALASAHLTRGRNQGTAQSFGTAFATQTDTLRRPEKRGRDQHDRDAPRERERERGTRYAPRQTVAVREPAPARDREEGQPDAKRKKDTRDVSCFNCGKKGHYARDCRAPKKAPEHRVAYSTTSVELGPYEVLLDNQADVSILHSRFLTDVRPRGCAITVSGLTGARNFSHTGLLRDFFQVESCNDCSANILCMADVEDKYEVTYVRGKHYIVHLPERDLYFQRRNKLYVADMSDWCNEEDEEHHAYITTALDNEGNYTAKEVEAAKAARSWLARAGYPSEREAVHLVVDGNVKDIDFTAADVRRAFAIYGPMVQAVRGKTVAKKVSRAPTDDLQKAQQTSQVLYTDIFYVVQKPFLMSVAEPLHLTLVTELTGETTNAIGLALQEQLGVVRARGFTPVRVYTDPQRPFISLVGKLPGVEVDPGGAGDHVDVADVKIKHIKELIRSVHAGLPWQLPGSLVKDIVYYAASRINTRRTTAGSTNIAPRVAFTGRKIESSEFSISFGDYCECKDPQATSNSAVTDRTEPCIALYPTGNSNGSWYFFNLATQKRVRRTQWRLMVTNKIVIDFMNRLPSSAQAIEEPSVTPSVPATPPTIPQRHEPNSTLEITIANQEAEDEHLHLPPATHEDASTLTGVAVDVAQGPEDDEATPVSTRRNSRPPSTLQDFVCNHLSMKKAIAQYGAQAETAIDEEIKQLVIDKKALVPVHQSYTKGKKIIPSHMFLKAKHDARGTFERIKARLVANGSQQDRELYGDVSSPTPSHESILASLVMAAKERRHAAVIDIGGAYLNADMDEDVYMWLDKHLSEKVIAVMPEAAAVATRNGTLVVKLNKALYGCIQSAKLWNDRISDFLVSIGYTRNEADRCVFNRVTDGKQSTLVLYVDDILVLSTNPAEITELEDHLKREFKEIKCKVSNDLSYLGMRIQFLENKVNISMEGYIEDILDCGGAAGTVSTPATATLFDVGDSEPLSEGDRQHFHTMVAKLLYLSKRIRPDISLAVSYLTTRVTKPNREDSKKLERVLRYLKKTKDDSLVLRCDGETKIDTYMDASFGNHQDGKSHSGYVTFMGKACIGWSSSKQKIVSKDSTEAELVALSDYVSRPLIFNEFLTMQGVQAPIKLFQDNRSTISLVQDGGGKPRTKHLRVRQFRVKEICDVHDISIIYCPTHAMIADVFTKPLQGNVFFDFKRSLGVEVLPRRQGCVETSKE